MLTRHNTRTSTLCGAIIQYFYWILNSCKPYILGILPKGPYMPCVSMAGGAFLAGCHRHNCVCICLRKQETMSSPTSFGEGNGGYIFREGAKCGYLEIPCSIKITLAGYSLSICHILPLTAYYLYHKNEENICSRYVNGSVFDMDIKMCVEEPNGLIWTTMSTHWSQLYQSLKMEYRFQCFTNNLTLIRIKTKW